MDELHSDRACNLCRQRRVRCDKTLPTCRRCSKFGQPCPGYPSKQRFVDQGSAVRKKWADEASDGIYRSNASSASPGISNVSESQNISRRKNDLSSPAGCSQTRQAVLFAPSHIPALVADNAPPKFSRDASDGVVQPQIPNNSLAQHHPYETFNSDTSMLQLLEDSGSDFFDLDIETYYANGNNACGFFPGVPVSLPQETEVEMLDIRHDSSSVSLTRNASPTPATVAESNNRKEVALLVQLFVNFLAPWMDLFDINAYFTRILPQYATLNILLQSALAAVAAKQTARHVMNGCATTSGRYYAYIMANYQNVSSNEWFYKAACYYDRGISHLRTCLQHSSNFVSPAMGFQTSTPTRLSPRDNLSGTPGSATSARSANTYVEAQHLFSAISVLSLYESLDDCFATSSQHLPGFLALFDRNYASYLPQTLTAGRAAFWYFARKEALSSYAHQVRPKIDPENMAVWISAGLPPGFVHFLSTDTSGSERQNFQDYVLEDEGADTMPYVLIWVLTKVVDLIASSDKESSSSPASQTFSPGNNTTGSRLGADDQIQARIATWNNLRELLRRWYDRRPALLIPHAIVDATSPFLSKSTKPVRTAFFACATGAAALQLYHFVQILLLMNQPTIRKDQGSRLRMLKENSAKVEHHSREISAIALGRQPLAIQRQMSHPLRLAGAYFEAQEDRDMIIEILREIAIETSSPIDLTS